MDYVVRTIPTNIREKTTLGKILSEWTSRANALYNQALFLIRNCLSSSRKNKKDWYDGEKEAQDTINSILPNFKLIRYKTLIHDLQNESEKAQGAYNEGNTEEFEKHVEKARSTRALLQKIINQNSIVGKGHITPNYYDLDAYFKLSKNENYDKLPAHVAQNTLKDVTTAIKNYFDAIRDYYNGNSRGYKGRPGLPKYRRKNDNHSTIQIPGDDLKIITNSNGKTQLKLPKISKSTLVDITNMVKEDEVLKCIRIVPLYNGDSRIELVRERAIPEKRTGGNMAGCDIGLNNLLAITVNDGETRPIIYPGVQIKSINRYFAKEVANAQRKLPKNVHTSKHIRSLYAKRKTQINDSFHWLARNCVQELLAANVSTLVIGYNTNMKDNFAKMISSPTPTKQMFLQMPLKRLVDYVVMACEEAGIEVIVREESYTSKSSLIDGDAIPVRYPDDTQKTKDFYDTLFTGKRVKRGLYRTREGILINADVNGAGNILRKEYYDAFDNVDSFKYLLNPRKILLPKLQNKNY